MNPSVEIVISGIAGRFPKSNNMKELQDNLMNKIDMITADGHGWKIGNRKKFYILYFKLFN